jgi:hydrogenase-4 component E
MKDYLNILSILILLSSFMLVANKRVDSCIKTFRLQSLLIAAAAGLLGIQNLYSAGEFDLIIICGLIIALKVIYIPKLLRGTVAKVEYKIEKGFFLNIPLAVLICFGPVILSYFAVSAIKGITDSNIRLYLVNSISIMLIGLFFMINRKKAVSQIIGFLVIENGLFTAAMLTTHGMPIIIDAGILVDLLTAVMIMGVLVFRINENFDSIDLNKLRNLRG